MGHYDDLYDAQAVTAAREKQLQTATTLANDLEQALTKLREVYAAMKREGYHQLAWERLDQIAKDLKAGPTQSREISIAITHIETAILWLKK